MLHGILLDAWPLALTLLAVCGAMATLARLVRADQRLPLAALHHDERGGVQSLSFVLTVPVFIMLMLLAVQITQLMIGLVTVHYAAYAAARSASVWTPARLWPIDSGGENRLGRRELERLENNGEVYRIEPGSEKYERIRRAAALACVPIAPSRDLGLATGDPTAQSLTSVYAAVAPAAMGNTRLPQRLANKWAYANLATNIEIRTFHRRYQTLGPYHDEPPLWNLAPLAPEGHFKENEIGWRDQIRVTVIHHFALLPGPGRLLARRANQSRYADTVSPQIQQAARVYWIPLSATATLVGEGEKSVRPYVQKNL